MKLGIMQPYFFPYIGYFDLIYQTDRWIVFDMAQFIRHGWITRNRILHPSDGWQYILLPVRKHSQKAEIKDILIVENKRWFERILGQLQHYKRHAPFFESVMAVVTECFRDVDYSLSQLNVICLNKVCNYLEIPFRFSYFSEMNLQLGPVEGPGDWALRIAEAVGANEYINAPGGADLFDRAKFEEAGIKLKIQTPVDFVYNCKGYPFQPNLSIIDVMMWNSPESIRSYLAVRARDDKK